MTAPILETIYPSGHTGRIPVAVICGDATPLTPPLRTMLAAAGHVAGFAARGGMTIGDEAVRWHAFNGSWAAMMLLRDPSITAAVVETDVELIRTEGIFPDRYDGAAVDRSIADEPEARRLIGGARHTILFEPSNTEAAAHEIARYLTQNGTAGG